MDTNRNVDFVERKIASHYSQQTQGRFNESTRQYWTTLETCVALITSLLKNKAHTWVKWSLIPILLGLIIAIMHVRNNCIIFFFKETCTKKGKKLNDQLNDEILLHNPCTLKDLKVHRQSIANQFTFQFCTGPRNRTGQMKQFWKAIQQLT